MFRLFGVVVVVVGRRARTDPRCTCRSEGTNAPPLCLARPPVLLTCAFPDVCRQARARSKPSAMPSLNQQLWSAALEGRHANMVAALDGGAEIDAQIVSRRAAREAVDRIAISQIICMKCVFLTAG